MADTLPPNARSACAFNACLVSRSTETEKVTTDRRDFAVVVLEDERLEAIADERSNHPRTVKVRGVLKRALRLNRSGDQASSPRSILSIGGTKLGVHLIEYREELVAA